MFLNISLTVCWKSVLIPVGPEYEVDDLNDDQDYDDASEDDEVAEVTRKTYPRQRGRYLTGFFPWNF